MCKKNQEIDPDSHFLKQVHEAIILASLNLVKRAASLPD